VATSGVALFVCVLLHDSFVSEDEEHTYTHSNFWF